MSSGLGMFVGTGVDEGMILNMGSAMWDVRNAGNATQRKAALGRLWGDGSGNELQKAITAGTTDATGAGYYDASFLQPEELGDAILDNASMEECVLFRYMLARQEQVKTLDPGIIRRENYEESGSISPFMAEVQGPLAQDPEYGPKTFFHVKGFGTEYGWSVLGGRVKFACNIPQGKEIAEKNARDRLTRMMERSLWRSESANTLMAGAGDSYGWDGIPAQIQAYKDTGDVKYEHVVIDCMGKDITGDTIRDIIYRQQQAGRMRHQTGNGGVIGNVDLIVDNNQYDRLAVQEDNRRHVLGNRSPGGFGMMPAIYTNYGYVPLVMSKHLISAEDQIRMCNALAPAAADPTGCTVGSPVNVILTAQPCDGTPGPHGTTRPVAARSRFGAHSTTGTWYVQAVIRGQSGRSARTNCAGPVAIIAGQAIGIEVQHPVSIANAWSVQIYRGLLATFADCFFVAEFPLSSVGPTFIYDTDETMPNSSIGVALEKYTETLSLGVLVPIMSLDLPMLRFSYVRTFFGYNAPMLKHGMRDILLKNIKAPAATTS